MYKIGISIMLCESSTYFMFLIGFSFIKRKYIIPEITVPTLSGCEDIYATKGQNVNCRINFDSDDEVYFLENNVDAKINISSSTVTYFQKSDDPVKIRYVLCTAFVYFIYLIRNPIHISTNDIYS
jgi:hypothetical protein